MKHHIVIFGAGISGCTIARLFAEQGHKVTIYERRNHVGGNIYDEYRDGILIQKYGPHIFHTNDEDVFKFLSRFTEWIPYVHKVKGCINDVLTNIPFNFKSIEHHFDSKTAAILQIKLSKKFGQNQKVPIFKLREENDKDMSKLADFIYKNVFEFYSKKQWGFSPEKLGKEVMERVPVYTGYDDRYFTDKYQCQPMMGFTYMIQSMLNHANITVNLNVDRTIDDYLNMKEVKIIYCGSIDEIYNHCLGKLKYRSLKFKFKTLECEQYQQLGVINYNTSKRYTRITEFKHLTGQSAMNTVICKEYPCEASKRSEPYYPIPTKDCQQLYKDYLRIAQTYNNLYFLGRLGTYKYLNMDAAVKQAMNLFDSITNSIELSRWI